jgi:hypothetical protein
VKRLRLAALVVALLSLPVITSACANKGDGGRFVPAPSASAGDDLPDGNLETDPDCLKYAKESLERRACEQRLKAISVAAQWMVHHDNLTYAPFQALQFEGWWTGLAAQEMDAQLGRLKKDHPRILEPGVDWQISVVAQVFSPIKAAEAIKPDEPRFEITTYEIWYVGIRPPGGEHYKVDGKATIRRNVATIALRPLPGNGVVQSLQSQIVHGRYPHFLGAAGPKPGGLCHKFTL